MDRNISRYNPAIRYTHRLTLLAIVVTYVLVELGDSEGSEGSSPPSLMLQGHYLAGLAVLTLLVPRIIAWIASPALDPGQLHRTTNAHTGE